MSENNGGPAFPFGTRTIIEANYRTDYKDRVIEGNEPGMTVRDYFAAKAMQAIAGREGYLGLPQSLAREAYEIADAMLAEREKGGAL